MANPRWAESMKLMSPMSGYEFQGFNMPGSGRLSVPDTSESNTATVTPNPGGVALRNVTVVPKSVPAAPNPVRLAPTHSVPVAANPATVATGPVAFAPHTVMVAPNSVTLAPTHSVPVAANPATVATGPVAFAPHTVTVAPNSVTLAPTPLTFAPHSVPVAPNPANLVMVAPNSAMVAPNSVGVQPTSSQPVPRASAPPTNLHLDFTKMTREQLNLYDDIPAPNAELAELLGRISRVRHGRIAKTCKYVSNMFVNSWHPSLLKIPSWPIIAIDITSVTSNISWRCVRLHHSLNYFDIISSQVPHALHYYLHYSSLIYIANPRWAESMKLMSPMSGYEFQGFNMPGSGRLSVPDTSESNNLFNLNSQKRLGWHLVIRRRP